MKTAGGSEAAKTFVPEGLLIHENKERKLQRRSTKIARLFLDTGGAGAQPHP